jgi:hypothetical protein
MRSAGRAQRVGFAAFAYAFVFAFLASGAAIASDVERQIPVIRDAAGSGLTVEISREGTRQTATPFLTLSEPTVQRVEDRIATIADRLAAKMAAADATVADSFPLGGLSGAPPEDSAQPQTTLSSMPPFPEEITIRNVKNFLKGVRASRKEKPAPAAVVAVPERRLGMADTSPRGAN